MLHVIDTRRVNGHFQLSLGVVAFVIINQGFWY